MPTANTPGENPALKQAQELITQPEVEKRKEIIRTSTAETLNEYARLLSLQKNVLLPQEKEEVRTRMEQLALETHNKLDLLKKNVHLARVVEEREVKPEVSEQAKKETILGQAKEYMKSIPYVGDFVAGLIPEKMPSMERMWLNALSTPGLIGSFVGEGWMKNVLTGMSANAMRKLAELDVRDFIKEEAYVGETISFTSITENAWKLFTTANTNQTPITELVKQYIDLKRDEHRNTPDQPFTLNFGIGDITKTEDLKKQVAEGKAAAIDAALQKKVETAFGVTSAKFGSETKIEDGALTLRKDDIDANGKAKPDTPAEAILKARTSLEGINVIEIAKGPVSIEWNGDRKIVKIPMSTKVDLKLIKEIAIMGEPNGISRVAIEKKDSFTQEQILRTLEGGNATLLVPNNVVVLKALPLVIHSLVTNENIGRNAKWQLMNGNNFVEIDKPAPSKAS